jgi:hypothetical protein
LVLKIVFTWKRFPIRLNFSEIPLTYWDNDTVLVYSI